MHDLNELAGQISDYGVKQVFGILGSGASYTLIDALESNGVNYIYTHHEAAGAIMAGATAKITGKAGVSITIKGPGLANLIPGLAVSQFESLPLVSISEAYLPSTPGYNAHKRLDHKVLTQEVVKCHRFISNNGPDFTGLANFAEQEIPGPVQFDIAANFIDTDEELNEVLDTSMEATVQNEIIDLIKLSKQPIIIAGTLAARNGCSIYLDNLSIPVFSVAAAKGVIDETLPHAAGVYTGVGLKKTPEYQLIQKADLIIGIGLRHSEVLAVKPFACKAINIDPAPDEYYSGFKFTKVACIDKQNTGNLFTCLSGKSWGIELLTNIKKKLEKHIVNTNFLPGVVYHIIEKHFKGKCRIILDTGNFCTIGEHICHVQDTALYLAAGQSRYMGVGLPQAIGCAFADSSIPTVVYLGDGGVGMYISEIKTALKYKLPILIVFMHDGYLSSIRGRAITDSLIESPVEVYNSSWVRVIDAIGIPAVRVESDIALEQEVDNWDNIYGPKFIEAAFDADLYQNMVTGIR